MKTQNYLTKGSGTKPKTGKKKNKHIKKILLAKKIKMIRKHKHISDKHYKVTTNVQGVIA